MELTIQDQDMLEQFLKNELPSKEKVLFQQKFNQDPTFKKACHEHAMLFKLLPMAEESLLKDKLKIWEVEWKQNKTKVISFRPKHWFAVAASLLVALGVVFVLNRPSQNEQLFLAYFEPYGTSEFATRGLNNGLTEGIELYKQKKYQSAINIFKSNESTESKLYEANAYLLLKEYAKAENLLEGRIARLEMKQENNNLLKWNYALSLVANDKTKQAIEVLEKLVQSDFYENDKANKLLEEIKSRK